MPRKLNWTFLFTIKNFQTTIISSRFVLLNWWPLSTKLIKPNVQFAIPIQTLTIWKIFYWFAME